jgi:putative flavoprotein involved in K+ transport
MSDIGEPAAREHFEIVVVGGGQAGLAVGYHLAKLGARFIILGADARIGDSWRNRWDSLQLFTPARVDALPGMPFPAPAHALPSKDAMADYLEAYVERFNLPVRLGVSADRLDHPHDRYVLTASGQPIEADQVVVATGANQTPRTPVFAAELRPEILQLNAAQYRNASQLKPGAVLVVGAGNSGSEIALDAARDHRTWLSGRSTGRASPVLFSRPGWWLATNLITRDSGVGRRVAARMLGRGAPLLRVTLKDIAAAGIERVGRTSGVDGGKPRLEDGHVLDVTNVVWCTGFGHDFGWIHLPVFDDSGLPLHARGVIASQPGLYFLGLPFLYGATSALIGGAGRDAKYIADHMAASRLSRSSWSEGIQN